MSIPLSNVSTTPRRGSPSAIPTSSACRKRNASTTRSRARAFEALGYNVAIHGQKGFNGVAILSKAPFDEVTARLPGDNGDEQARFLEAVISTPGGVVRVASIYLPNGNPPETDKYPYKIKWMDRLIDYARERMALEEPLVMAGDYNVIPTVADARNPSAWVGDALFLPPTRGRFRSLINLGLTDAVRAASDSSDLYTFWDYQAGAWQKNNGIRIDHVLLSPQATDRFVSATIDQATCGLGKSRPTTFRWSLIWRST